MAQELTTQAGRNIARSGEDSDRTAMAFTPAVDIFAQGDVTVIKADMPGVAPDDVEVTLERQVLTLQGRVRPHAPEGYRRLSQEYREGDYLRVFTLSDEVDQKRIKADFKNGVLRLELPRAAEAKPKKISVKAA
ncbi:Spore protein SP21 [Defluviimonas aquaemixtae]|uniref:Spore protein SP21 n=1 Tax=Albidovulum aquaemixtae TaxID=1542388 RepID=A0A2R8B4B3_9RHOB|nr:Hsp20/alpha crystallin family protein [Defluviimonas aquaemixtae]SPH17471.1 Spore protein SP21 [Defluviimonas aquaemixtae]